MRLLYYATTTYSVVFIFFSFRRYILYYVYLYRYIYILYTCYNHLKCIKHMSVCIAADYNYTILEATEYRPVTATLVKLHTTIDSLFTFAFLKTLIKQS